MGVLDDAAAVAVGGSFSRARVLGGFGIVHVDDCSGRFRHGSIGGCGHLDAGAGVGGGSVHVRSGGVMGVGDAIDAAEGC